MVHYQTISSCTFQVYFLFLLPNLPLHQHSQMSKRSKIWAVGIMALFVLPNAYVVIKGTEDFPFTCAPMFGHYIGESTYLYDFKFIGEGTNTEKQLHPVCHGISEMWSMRLLFNKVYGSMEPHSPFGDHVNDSSEQFEARLSEYFARYFNPADEAFAKTNGDFSNIRAVRFEIDQYTRQKEKLTTHVVGYYNPSTKTFTHTWTASR